MSLVAIKDILPNPYRHIQRYPINPEKVGALRESLRTTTYWDNLVGRPRGKKVEIAYGHHRLEALKKEYGLAKKVRVITRDLDDEQMLQIMARENMEVFGTNAVVEQETVRAVVEAAADGTIQIEPPPPGANKRDIRFAPSFAPGQKPPVAKAVPYTSRSVATFLGWTRKNGEPQSKVSSTLRALQLVEEGLLKEAQFNALSSTQAAAVVDGAWKVRERLRKAAEEQRKAAERRLREAEKHRRKLEKEKKLAEQRAAKAKDAKRKQKALEEARSKERERQKAAAEEERRRKEAEEEKRREAARRREARRRAKKTGTELAKGLKDGDLSVKEARKIAEDEAPKVVSIRQIERATARLAEDVAGILTDENDTDRYATLATAIRERKRLTPQGKKSLVDALKGLAGRAEEYARKLAAAP